MALDFIGILIKLIVERRIISIKQHPSYYTRWRIGIRRTAQQINEPNHNVKTTRQSTIILPKGVHTKSGEQWTG